MRTGESDQNTGTPRNSPKSCSKLSAISALVWVGRCGGFLAPGIARPETASWPTHSRLKTSERLESARLRRI